MGKLYFYQGLRISEHFGDGYGSHTRTTYGEDVTGNVTYDFNSLGFRGKEFDPGAKKIIFVCGASDTVGTGLNWEETWPAQFAKLYAEDTGIEEADVSLMNFSEGGCSNRYISRTLIQQSGQVRPDLVIAHFTYISRNETLVPSAALKTLFPVSRNSEHVSFTSWGYWSILSNAALR